MIPILNTVLNIMLMIIQGVIHNENIVSRAVSHGAAQRTINITCLRVLCLKKKKQNKHLVYNKAKRRRSEANFERSLPTVPFWHS